MTLKEKLDAKKKEMASMAPKEVLAAMEKATQDLQRSGLANRARAEGDEAPDFTLNNSRGEQVNLAARLDGGPVVLGFYRGRW